MKGFDLSVIPSAEQIKGIRIRIKPERIANDHHESVKRLTHVSAPGYQYDPADTGDVA